MSIYIIYIVQLVLLTVHVLYTDPIDMHVYMINVVNVHTDTIKQTRMGLKARTSYN